MTIWKKFKALLSGIELNRKVPRHPAHLWYGLLSFLCIPAALVMHGHVHYTLGVTLLALPLSLVVFIPYRYFNILSRMILNALIFGAGCFWISFRLKHDIPVDKLMVETLALWSLTFLTTGKSKGYFYLLFIDIILLLYGALLPRLLSLYLTIGAFAVILIILFRNRTGFLSGDMLLGSAKGTFKRTWHFCLIWLVFAGLGFHFAFGLIPLTDNKLEGLIPVSFTTERNSFATPALQEWLKSGQNVKNGPDSRKTDEDAPGEHTALSRQKGKAKPVDLPNPPKNTPLIPGNGGASMGKELVFRVKSPLKLYHLARLYDLYDGTRWRVSAPMRRNVLRNKNPEDPAQQVKLSYSVEKLFSTSLAIPWQYNNFELENDFKSVIRYTMHFWGVELHEPPSRMPLKFTAEVTLPTAVPAASSEGSTSRIWEERIPRHYYLQLPRTGISLRVKALARTITKDAKTPYAKALALRDFLRSNYTYKLHAVPTPRHRESVDYFLFYLGEGHCEYFASALAVLARCAGLPSRVATGFSPGNYNTLTSLFEVFENHAHAWTQIYIPEFGWLTFDATPPSAIVSETYPPGLGKMRDPFGDEWRVRPPELTDNALSYMQKLKVEAERKKQGPGNVQETLNEIAAAGDKLREGLKKEHEQKKKPPVVKPVKGGFDPAKIRAALIESFIKFQKTLTDLALYVVSSWLRLLTATVVLLAGTFLAVGMVILVKRWCRKLHFLLLRRKGKRCKDPVKAIRSSCRAALMVLELEKMPRKGNQELLEYAAALPPLLREKCVELFKIFYRAEYRSTPPEKEEARRASQQLYALCKLLKKRDKA